MVSWIALLSGLEASSSGDSTALATTAIDELDMDSGATEVPARSSSKRRRLVSLRSVGGLRGGGDVGA